MRKEHKVAQYLIKAYEEITASPFGDSELTLQKLMYFCQKMSLAFTGEPIFEEEFEGWVHGPVLTSVRGYFDIYEPYSLENNNLSETDKYIIDNTIYEYGKFAAWTLRDMSHNEQAWLKSRAGLDDSERGNKLILLSDIIEDAKNVRLYDHQFDMYIDEFEDCEEDFISV